MADLGVKFREICQHCRALFRLPTQVENLGIKLEEQSSQAVVLREAASEAAKAAADAQFIRLSNQIQSLANSVAASSALHQVFSSEIKRLNQDAGVVASTCADVSDRLAHLEAVVAKLDRLPAANK